MSSNQGVKKTELETMEVDAFTCEFAATSSQDWSVIPKIDETSNDQFKKPSIERLIYRP